MSYQYTRNRMRDRPKTAQQGNIKGNSNLDVCYYQLKTRLMDLP